MSQHVKKANSLCKGLILHNLEKRIVNSYSKTKTAKEIYDSLEKQYKDDESLVKFEDCKFKENKPMLPQVKDLLQINQKIAEDEMKLPERYLVGCILNKLSASWVHFATDIYRKKTEVKMDDLLRLIKIEDEVKQRIKQDMIAKQVAMANVVSLVESKVDKGPNRGAKSKRPVSNQKNKKLSIRLLLMK